VELLYVLLVLLVVTRAFGAAAQRLGQPVLAGELVAGIVVGMVAARYSGTFPVLASLPEDEVFRAITDLGIFVLMLQAGMELRPRDLARASRSAVGVAIGGMFLPLALGFGLAWMFLPASDLRFAQALFLGVALAITAVPVSVKVLMDLGKLDTAMGRTIVSAAIYDDVLSLVLLAVLTAILERGAAPGAGGLLLLGGNVLVFFLVSGVAGRYVLPWIGRFVKGSDLDELEFSLLLIVAFAFALLAEALDMHFMLGSFVAGLFFGRRTIDGEVFDAVSARVSALSTGFLAPVFFASIGLHTDLTALFEVPVFVILLIAAASIGKIAGCYAPARLAGLDRRESFAVGAAMNARGAVELVIAGVALRAGLFELPDPPPPVVANLFASVVLMAIVTTVSTPLVMQRVCRNSSG